MIEPLNSTNLQKLSVEMASSRLETLLRIGQTQVARVLETTVPPSAARTNVPAQTRTEPGQPRPEPSSTTSKLDVSTAPTTVSKPSPPSRSTSASVNAAADKPPQPQGQPRMIEPRQAVPTTTDTPSPITYRARLLIAGQVVEINSPRPLPTGLEIRVTREQDNRLLLTLPRELGGNRSTVNNISSDQAHSQNRPSPPTQATTSAIETLLRPGERALARVIHVTAEPAPATTRRPDVPASPTSTTATQKTTAVSRQAESPVPAVSRPVTPPAAQPGPITGQQLTNSQPSTGATGYDRTRNDPQTPTSPAADRTQAKTPPPSTTSSAGPIINSTTNRTSESGQYRVTLDLHGRSLVVLTPKPLAVGTEVRLQQNSQGQVTLHLPADKTQALETH